MINKLCFASIVEELSKAAINCKKYEMDSPEYAKHRINLLKYQIELYEYKKDVDDFVETVDKVIEKLSAMYPKDVGEEISQFQKAVIATLTAKAIKLRRR